MNTPATVPAIPAEMAAQLAQLRDIRLPDAVSWWPLAPGWWVLLGLLVIAALCGIGLEIRRRHSLKYRALRELEALKTKKAAQLTAVQLATDLCVLVRRIVLSKLDGSRFANTHGEAWSEYLAGAPNGMPVSIAHFIASAPYINDTAARRKGNASEVHDIADKQALIVATETWIRRHA